MAEIVPSLPDAHIVRTYPKDYAASDTESEREVEFEADMEDEEQVSVALRLVQNQEFLDQQIASPSAWVLEPQTWQTTEGTDVVLIRKPTASNLSHSLLNPYIYRNIQKVGTLNDLAALLDTPDDWEVRYTQVVADGYIIRMLNLFSALPDDVAESTIQFHFAGLVSCIAAGLGVTLLPDSETSIIVGGILARYQYDLRSKTDPHFFDISGRNLIASEAKTHITYAPGEMWYHASRGVQVLSALYAYNSPTFLFTQRQWKLFIENSDRNAVLTFPYDDNPNHTPHVNSSLVMPMGTTFLKAIVICLLSRRVSLEDSMKAVTLKELSQIKDTPQKIIIKPKYFDTPEKPKRQSARLRERPKPSYVSGYDELGHPIYTLIRVVPPEVVARIEDEITVQEKKEHEKQTSQMTLVE
jgi:hypothetical protein